MMVGLVPPTAVPEEITWASSNPQVASVTPNDVDPVAGVMYNDKLDVAGIRGYYRSSTLRLPSLAWVLYIYNDDHKMDGSSFGRFYGYSIRPVIK